MTFEIDTESQVPIYEQLRNQIVLGIASKKLASGESLLSARKLAAELNVNFHTVNKTFALLCEEGFLVMDRQKGAVVSKQVSPEITALEGKLELLAAEAICRGMDHMNFVSQCIMSFRKAQGEV